jgi:hypothetical protein
MADNVTASPGSGGAVFATDDIGSVHWPFAKQAWGPRDSANEVDDAAGKRLPVKLGEGLGASSVVAGQVAVGTSEVSMATATARRFRVRALLTNTATVYLGPTGVTTATGYPLEPGDVFPHPLELSNLNVLKAIAGAAGQALAYLGEV